MKIILYNHMDGVYYENLIDFKKFNKNYDTVYWSKCYRINNATYYKKDYNTFKGLFKTIIYI
jgi:hypothetical protein